MSSFADLVYGDGASSRRMPMAVAAARIPVGQRNVTLASLAGTMRSRGMNSGEIAAALQVVNAQRCVPPLDAAEVERIAASIARYAPDPEPFRIAGGRSGEEVVLRPDVPWPAPPDEAAYHGVLGAITRAVEDTTEADPAGILGTLLVAFGALAGNGHVMYQGGPQAPSLFVVLVGGTAVSRKGTAYQLVRRVFQVADVPLDSVLTPGIGSGEGLVGHLQRLENDNRALITESEFGRLLRVANREGSTLSPLLREAWDGVPLGRILARQGSVVTDHHVCCYGNTTAPELRSVLTDLDAANGLGNRFLWFSVRRTRRLALTVAPDRHIAPHAADLALAVAFARQPGQMTFSPDASVRWSEWYEQRMPRLGLLGALTARAEAQVIRIAIIYALTDRTNVIGPDHLKAAMAVWDFAERSAAHIFGESTGNRHADELLDWLRRDGELPWDDAKRGLGLRLAADMSEVVGVLTDAGLVDVLEVKPAGGGGGRRRRVIRAKDAKGANDAEAAQGSES